MVRVIAQLLEISLHRLQALELQVLFHLLHGRFQVFRVDLQLFLVAEDTEANFSATINL